MATTVVSLVNRVRDLLDDYGAARTTLAAAVATAGATTISLTDGSVMEVGDFISINGETMQVTKLFVGSPDTATVERGARGSTATTHASGDPVRVNLAIIPQRIVNAINLAIASAYPEISIIDTGDTTLSTVNGQELYAVPTGIDHVRQVWIESSTSGVYNLDRYWDMANSGYIHIYGNPPSGRTIKVVGTGRFGIVDYEDSLDASWPVHAAADSYLVYWAAGHLVSEQQIPVSRRDGFKGITDAFQQTAPTISLATGEKYTEIAKRFLREVARDQVLPERTEPDMDRFWVRRA